MPNQILNTLMRLQPGARRVDLPNDEGFDDDTTAFSGPGRMDPSVELFGLQGDRKRELQDRMVASTKAPNRFVPGELDGLKRQLGFLEQDMAPMQDQIDADRLAQMSGFSSSEEAGGFGRNLETAKVMSPLNVANTTGRYNVEGRRIAGDTAVRQAEAQARGALDRTREQEATKRQGFGALQGLFGGPTSDSRSMSMSVPGVGAISRGAERAEPVVPAALQTNLMNARREFARTGNPQAKATLDQAIANIIQSTPVDDMTKQWAHTIATDPRLSAMPIEQIIQLHNTQNPDDNIDANEIVELRNLLSQLMVGMQDPQ